MQDRDQIRRIVQHRRDMLSAEERRLKSDAIWKRLAVLPVFEAAELALFYLSFKSEVETALMRQIAREQGKQVAAPRARPGSNEMAFHLLPSEELSTPGPYGILQPAADLPLADLKRSSVVLVPGSAFDRQGNRLGWGGGHYDRWLSGPGKGLPTVGLAFHEQLVDHIPAASHDVPMDWVLTDMETIQR
jgi:5-formyltetrahydrofolate cyclo-ligase